MTQYVIVFVSVAVMLYIGWRIYKNLKANDGIVMELLFMIWLAISIVGNAVFPSDKFIPFWVQLIVYAVIVRLITHPPKRKDSAENQE
jgi:membrane protein insertase Oxa1/YidC/SpoIIIJ